MRRPRSIRPTPKIFPRTTTKTKSTTLKITMNNKTKCPTAKGTRAASKKPTTPRITQESLFAKKLNKIAARQKRLPAKSDKKIMNALVVSQCDFDEAMFNLIDAVQKTAAAVQEMGSAYALLAERGRKNGEEVIVAWMLPEEQEYFLEVAARFPCPTMLENLSHSGLWRLAGFLPDAPSTKSGNLTTITQSTKDADPTTNT